MRPTTRPPLSKRHRSCACACHLHAHSTAQHGRNIYPDRSTQAADEASSLTACINQAHQEGKIRYLGHVAREKCLLNRVQVGENSSPAVLGVARCSAGGWWCFCIAAARALHFWRIPFSLIRQGLQEQARGQSPMVVKGWVRRARVLPTSHGALSDGAACPPVGAPLTERQCASPPGQVQRRAG